MADDRDPDLTDEAPPKGVSEGYPEEEPAGDDASSEHAFPDDAEHEAESTDAPSTSSEHESGPAKATGNPRAAGGD